MNLDDYRLSAYKKASDKDKPKTNDITANYTESISSEIKKQGTSNHMPLVHKPIFEKVNSRIGDILENDRAEKENLEQAKIAAKTGVWYSKKVVPTQEELKTATQKLTSGGLIKVPEQPREPGHKDSIYRRVAKFLVIIGVNEAAKILPHLTQEQTEKIIPEIAAVQNISQEESEKILEEFKSLLDTAREGGGVDTARSMLTKAYGSKRAEDIIEKTVAFSGAKPFDYLSEANAERIGVLLNGESEAVQALVLSQIDPKKSAGVINAMDEKTKSKVVLRLAKMKPVAPAVLESVNKSLYDKMLMQNTDNSQNLDGRGVLAQILKRMDPQAETSIMAALTDEDPELGADLRRRLFTEEDIINADDKFLQNKLHDMEDKEILYLLRGKKSDFRQKILSNVSHNRGASILEEEQMVDYILKSECDKVTAKFFSDLRRAWESGELRIFGRDDEVYV